ncbi:hypothetical protein DPR02_15540 [Burkholderia cepacia]|uniref:Uncharacterized protein n=1 Tax=Burkholderia cepacia TaxID=292 RepID=A0AAQ0FD11_BURCE|nr:hypothetical protein [Burkholderia cepacia]RAQ10240.1 hypothetical protein DPR02_15540 [Burkholderia cepacia]
MKALLTKLFKRYAEPAAAYEVAPAPKPSPTTRKPGGKRRYSQRKPRHPAPHGATRIDPAGPLIEQARQARGIKQ